MRKIAVVFAFIAVTMPMNPGYAQLADAETITAVNTASSALDEAFVVGSAGTIRSLVTSDHIAVTPYYDAPTTTDEMIATLPDLKYNQTVIGEPSVSLLAPDVALRTFIAELDGSFKGEPLPKRVFVNETLVNRNGEWLERFYQVTTLEQ